MSCDIWYSFAWTIDQIKQYLLTHEPNEQDVQSYVTNDILSKRLGFLMVEDLEQQQVLLHLDVVEEQNQKWNK